MAEPDDDHLEPLGPPVVIEVEPEVHAAAVVWRWLGALWSADAACMACRAEVRCWRHVEPTMVLIDAKDQGTHAEATVEAARTLTDCSSCGKVGGIALFTPLVWVRSMCEACIKLRLGDGWNDHEPWP